MSIKYFATAAMMGILALTVPGNNVVAEEWEFSATQKITLHGVSGDVVVRGSDNSMVLVQLQADVNPPEAFEPRVVLKRSSLSITE